MIKSKGSKVYSVEQIKRMAVTGFTEEFVDCLYKMPESLREMVMSWASEKIVNAAEEMHNHIENEPEESEANPTEMDGNANVDSCGDDMDYAMSENVESENVKELCEDSEARDDSDVSMKCHYCDFSKNARIDTNRLFAKIVNEDFLYNHEHLILKRQVVISYDNNKKYGMMLDTCDVCREIYLIESDQREYEELFDKKGVEYEFYR